MFPVAAPTISLAKGDGAIRGIGEKLATNPATDAGTLSMLLPVSNGFGSVLELGHDSGSDNGPFGLGWQIELLSITRKISKGIPAYRDGLASQAGELPTVPLVSEWEDPRSISAWPRTDSCCPG